MSFLTRKVRYLLSIERQQYARIALFLIALCYLGFLAYQSLSVSLNLSDEERARIVDLQEEGLKAKFRFAKAEYCPQAENDCKVLAAYNDQSWLSINPPNFNIRSQTDFDKSTESKEYAYYRFWLNVPERLLKTNAPISFSPHYILHDHYQIFVNDQLVVDEWSHSPKAPNIPLDRFDLTKPVFVAIKASLGPADLGILHKGSWHLGNQFTIDRVTEKLDTNSRVIGLSIFATQAGIFVLFCFFAFYAPLSSSFLYFLFFLSCCTLDYLFKIDAFHIVMSYNATVLLAMQVRTIKSFLFLGFVLSNFGIRFRADQLFIAMTIACGISLVASMDYAWLTHTVQLAELIYYLDLLFFACSAAASIVSVWAMYHGHVERNEANIASIAFIAVYSGAFLVNTLSSTYSLYSLMPVFDLALVMLLGLLCAHRYRKTADLLKRRELELANLRVDETLSKAARILAHDVRTPFSNLVMAVSALSTSSSSADSRSLQGMFPGFIKRIKSQLETVDGIIQNILVAGKGQARSTSSNSSICRNLHRSLNDVFSNKQERALSFTCQLRHEHLVKIDSTALHRILQNLLSNAADAVNQGGKIWLKSREVYRSETNFVHVTIGNSGSFLDPELYERVFEVDFSSGKKNGNGLGLAIAKQLIQLVGGRIWCTSDRSGGTEFHFELPTSTLTECLENSKLIEDWCTQPPSLRDMTPGIDRGETTH